MFYKKKKSPSNKMDIIKILMMKQANESKTTFKN